MSEGKGPFAFQVLSLNSPFPSFGFPLSQNESSCKNFSYENEFHLHENELVDETHFHKSGFVLRLALTQWQTRTRKWVIYLTLKTTIRFTYSEVPVVIKQDANKKY